MHLRQAMLSSALQQNVTLLLSFATGVVIAHLLTPREAGSYSVALAAVNLFAALKDTAVGSYVISVPEIDSGLLRIAFGLSLTIAGVLSVALLALSFSVTAFYHDPDLGESLRILALAQFGPALAFPITVRLTRALRFDSLLAIGLAAAAAQSLVSITLAALGYGAAGLAWGYFASTGATAITTVIYMPDALRLRPTLIGSRRLLAFGGWMSSALLVGSAGMSAPELIIGRALGLADAALFSRAQNLVSSIRNILFVGMTRPLLPSLGERESKGESLGPIYLRIVETVTGMAWPAYAVLAIWATPMVTTIYGHSWSAAGTMMTPIAIAHALTLTVAPHYDILIVKRRQRLLFLCEVSVFVFTIVALAVGLIFGRADAIWSLVLSSAFFAACYFGAIKSVIGFEPTTLAKTWLRSLGVTLAAVPVPLVFRYAANDTPGEILFGFAASSAISAVFWVAAVMFLGHELSPHINALLKAVSAPPRVRLSWKPACGRGKPIEPSSENRLRT
jgi:O-antigen/teichoic acid export membrane protein